VIADWHLGATPLRLAAMRRPFSNERDLFSSIKGRHNAIVNPDSRVLVIGDVVCDSAIDPHYWLDTVKQLNGKKTLIRGNHDRKFELSEFMDVFDIVIPEGDGIEFEAKSDLSCFSETPCFATHYPTRGRMDRFNITGHVHDAWRYQLNMLNVGCDVQFFTPLPVAKIPFFLKSIEEFYDDDAWAAYLPINAIYQDRRGKKGSRFPEKDDEGI